MSGGLKLDVESITLYKQVVPLGLISDKSARAVWVNLPERHRESLNLQLQRSSPYLPSPPHLQLDRSLVIAIFA